MSTQSSFVGDKALLIQLAGITVFSPGYSLTVEYKDPNAVLDAIRSLLEAAPVISEASDGVEVTFHDWSGLRVLVPNGAPASIAASVNLIGDVGITTDDGIEVGSTRASAIAAGARDVGEGADSLGLDAREAEGTTSLTRAGEVGLDFLRLRVSNGAVAQIQAPASDYGDV